MSSRHRCARAAPTTTRLGTAVVRYSHAAAGARRWLLALSKQTAQLLRVAPLEGAVACYAPLRHQHCAHPPQPRFPLLRWWPQEIERRYLALVAENERLQQDAKANQERADAVSQVGRGAIQHTYLASRALWGRARLLGASLQQRGIADWATLPTHRPTHPNAPHPQELREERAARERLASEATGRDSAHAQARSQVLSLTAERNSLSSLVDQLKGQLAAKGAELAAQLEAAGALAAERAAAEARAREAERAKSRLELETAQLKEVRGVQRGRVGGATTSQPGWGRARGVGGICGRGEDEWPSGIKVEL